MTGSPDRHPGRVDQGFRDLLVTSSEGLRLYARDYGRRHRGATPVVCLPGLARTSRDFHALATSLAGDPVRPRRVLALDYRGRGRSERDPNWRRYDVRVELGDVLQVLTVAGVDSAAVIGTSRGGLIAMGLAAARPTLLRAVVLNDIGPEIEAAGLKRIRGYVGKLPAPATFAEAAKVLKRLFGDGFPRMDEAAWIAFAQGTWQEEGGRLVPAYDPALLKPLATMDLDQPLPLLWPFFEGLARVPVMVLRGANSDLLSAATVEAMTRRHPDLEAVTVPDQGHAPLLDGPDLIARIRSFLDRADDGRRTPRQDQQALSA